MISYIVVHCSASTNGHPVTVLDIDSWHKERGFLRNGKWAECYNPHLKHIGYHYIVHLDGELKSGRHLDEVGAHAHGYNKRSLGVCIVGIDEFTVTQWYALADIVLFLKQKYPLAQIVGHRDLPDVQKACPGFNVNDWIGNRLKPLSDHVWTPS